MCGSQNDQAETEKVPLIAKVWCSIAQSAPKVNVPISSTRRLDVGLTIVSSFVMFIVLQIVRTVMERMFHWPPSNHPSPDVPDDKPRITWEAAACLAGVFHSINLVLALGALLSTAPYRPSGKMSDSPVWWQTTAAALLQFCTGYMIYDGLVNIVCLRYDAAGRGELELTSPDLMFLGHHFATAYYMTGTRVLGAGHISAMMLMFLGELSNPLFNVYLVSELAKKMECCAFPRSFVVVLEVALSVVFLVLRVFVGPAACVHITYDLFLTASGRRNIPLIHRILWNLMMWGVIVGGIPWIFFFVDLLKFHLLGGDDPHATTAEHTEARDEL